MPLSRKRANEREQRYSRQRARRAERKAKEAFKLLAPYDGPDTWRPRDRHITFRMLLEEI